MINSTPSTSAARSPWTTAKLRDHLLDGLSTLPGRREFHIHVLQSAPRKSNSLFPFATPRAPRAYLQDILLLLSESVSGVREDGESHRVLVSALEAQVYHLTVTSSAVLYISKVDSTGQGAKPAPTSALVRSLVSYYCDPKTRPLSATHMWVQLFARAQGQYLFPGSKDWEGKGWLSDSKLCAWWKRLLTKVMVDLEKGKHDDMKLKMYYVLPGYSAEEAESTLRIAAGGARSAVETSTVGWEYGHPYSQKDVPLPCPRSPDEGEGFGNLGYFIPYFDDDPKSRFLDEIAHTTEEGEMIRNPQPKKRKKLMRTESQPQELFPPKTEVSKEKEKEDNRPLGDLGKVGPDEFWERMSFRQECVSGAVTGFFSIGVSCTSGYVSEQSPLEPLAGQVSSRMNKRLMTNLTTGTDFSSRELAIKSTETLEAAIRGLCDGMAVREKTPERRDRACTPPPRHIVPEVSPNPFPEPVVSVETYGVEIYGRRRTENEVIEDKNRQVEHVQVLLVRKRKIK